VIRRLYGSDRQRTKLLEMLRRASTGREAGGVATKSRRRLIGGRGTVDGEPADLPGRLEREGRMAESYNDTVQGAPTARRQETSRRERELEDELVEAAQAMKDRGGVVSFLFDKTVGFGVRRTTQSIIYNALGNEALGKLLFTRGKKDLLDVIEQIERVQRGEPLRPSDLMPGGPKGGGAGGPGRARRSGLGMLAREVQDSEDARNGIAGFVAGGFLGSAPAVEDGELSEREFGEQMLIATGIALSAIATGRLPIGRGVSGGMGARRPGRVRTPEGTRPVVGIGIRRGLPGMPGSELPGGNTPDIPRGQPRKLRDVVQLSKQAERPEPGMEADFYISAVGTEDTIGTVSREWSPSAIGVWVKRPDLLNADYLRYAMMHMQDTGVFRGMMRGTAQQFITVGDLARIPLAFQGPARRARSRPRNSRWLQRPRPRRGEGMAGGQEKGPGYV